MELVIHMNPSAHDRIQMPELVKVERIPFD